MGLSILWIMFFHGTWAVENSVVLSFLKKYGNIGVDIFLILSGIGLYYSFQRIKKIYKDEGRHKYLIEFYKRRFLRIIPITIICLLPWYLYLYRNTSISIWRFILDSTSFSYWIDGKNRGWYVALTMILYLLYPFVYMIIEKRRKRGVLLILGILVISSIAINVLISLIFPKWYSSVELALARIPIFLFGCSVAPLVKEKNEKTSVFVICVIMIPVLWILLEKYRSYFYIFSMWRYIYGALGFCITVLLSWLLHLIHRKCTKTVIAYVGQYTLEIYLIHTQILTISLDHLNTVFKSSFSTNLFAVLASFVLAIGFHELMGKVIPTNRFKPSGIT